MNSPQPTPELPPSSGLTLPELAAVREAKRPSPGDRWAAALQSIERIQDFETKLNLLYEFSSALARSGHFAEALSVSFLMSPPASPGGTSHRPENVTLAQMMNAAALASISAALRGRGDTKRADSLRAEASAMAIALPEPSETAHHHFIHALGLVRDGLKDHGDIASALRVNEQIYSACQLQIVPLGPLVGQNIVADLLKPDLHQSLEMLVQHDDPAKALKALEAAHEAKLIANEERCSYCAQLFVRASQMDDQRTAREALAIMKKIVTETPGVNRQAIIVEVSSALLKAGQLEAVTSLFEWAGKHERSLLEGMAPFAACAAVRGGRPNLFASIQGTLPPAMRTDLFLTVAVYLCENNQQQVGEQWMKRWEQELQKKQLLPDRGDTMDRLRELASSPAVGGRSPALVAALVAAFVSSVEERLRLVSIAARTAMQNGNTAAGIAALAQVAPVENNLARATTAKGASSIARDACMCNLEYAHAAAVAGQRDNVALALKRTLAIGEKSKLPLTRHALILQVVHALALREKIEDIALEAAGRIEALLKRSDAEDARAAHPKGSIRRIAAEVRMADAVDAMSR